MALAFLDDRNRDFVECLPYVDMRKEFEVLRELGRGSFARVLLVRRRDTDELFAAKMVRLDQTPDNPSSEPVYMKNHRAKETFQFELTLAYFLSPCPYIIRTQSDAFRTNHHMIALMEPALGGDLASRLRDPKTRINEQQLKSIAIQLASAIQFIHERSLVHGDIRPENVLIIDQSMNVVKLGDFSRTKKSGSMVRYGSVMFTHPTGISFGRKPPPMTTSFSTTEEPPEPSRRCSAVTVAESLCTPTASDAFWPPEIVELSPSDFYTVHASQDAWGFGLILFCLSIERVPSWLVCSPKRDSFFAAFVEALHSATLGTASISGISGDVRKTAAQNRTLSFYQRSLSRLTTSFINLLHGMLEIDPSSRAQIKTVRNCALHKWLQDVKQSKLVSKASNNNSVRNGLAVGNTKLLNGSTQFIVEASNSSSSQDKVTRPMRAQSETALNELNLSTGDLAIKTRLCSQENAHAPSSSSTASFSAGSSAGDPL